MYTKLKSKYHTNSHTKLRTSLQPPRTISATTTAYSCTQNSSYLYIMHIWKFEILIQVQSPDPIFWFMDAYAHDTAWLKKISHHPCNTFNTICNMFTTPCNTFTTASNTFASSFYKLFPGSLGIFAMGRRAPECQNGCLTVRGLPRRHFENTCPIVLKDKIAQMDFSGIYLHWVKLTTAEFAALQITGPPLQIAEPPLQIYKSQDLPYKPQGLSYKSQDLHRWAQQLLVPDRRKSLHHPSSVLLDLFLKFQALRRPGSQGDLWDHQSSEAGRTIAVRWSHWSIASADAQANVNRRILVCWLTDQRRMGGWGRWRRVSRKYQRCDESVDDQESIPRQERDPKSMRERRE